MRDRNRISRLFFIEGLALGLFLSSVVLFCVEIVRSLYGQVKLTESPWLLILPIVASTYVSLRAVAEQSRLQTDSEDERYDREKRLAQAELPLALSGLLQECSLMIKYHFNVGAPQVEWLHFDLLFDGLKPAIRSSGQTTAGRLLKIIRTYQVLRARMHDFDATKRDHATAEGETLSELEVWSSAINWAVLYAMLETVFSYARGVVEEISAVEVNDCVTSAFFLNGIMIENYPVLQRMLKKRRDRGVEMNFED